jgi:hypothetical protein
MYNFTSQTFTHMKKTNKHTLLKGEGINQHTLYGDFAVDTEATDYARLVVDKDSVLRHETPSGQFAEHKALGVDKGNWSMGKQVEYNPFDNRVSRVWD